MGTEGKKGAKKKKERAVPGSFLSHTTLHELSFWSSPKKRAMMQFPVLSRYFLLADKVKVIAALMTVLHPIKKPPLPAQFPALLHSVSILAGTVLFSYTFRRRQASALQWQLPLGTGPAAGIPKVTSWGEEGPGEAIPSYQRV